MNSLVAGHSRGQHVGTAVQKRLKDPFERPYRLAFAIDDFGITAAAAAVEIDLGLIEIGRGGLASLD